jgi:hypothetical protein
LQSLILFLYIFSYYSSCFTIIGYLLWLPGHSQHLPGAWHRMSIKNTFHLFNHYMLITYQVSSTVLRTCDMLVNIKQIPCPCSADFPWVFVSERLKVMEEINYAAMRGTRHSSSDSQTGMCLRAFHRARETVHGTGSPSCGWS